MKQTDIITAAIQHLQGFRDQSKSKIQEAIRQFSYENEIHLSKKQTKNIMKKILS